MSDQAIKSFRRALLGLCSPALLMVIAAGPLHAATDLGISVDVSITDPVAGGAAFEYTILVTNHGPDAAENVVVIDPLPPGIVLANPNIVVEVTPPDSGFGFICTGPGVHENGAVICEGDMPAPLVEDPTVEITMIVQVIPSVAEGVRFNTATVISDTQEAGDSPNFDEVQLDIQVNGTLSLAMAGTPQVISGNEIIYQILLTNNGSSDVINPIIVQDLPAGTSFLAYYGTGALHDACFADGGGTQVLCDPGRVPAGSHFLVVLAQTYPGITPSGDATSTATVTDDGNSTDTSGSPAVVVSEVLNQSTVTVSKTFSDSNPADVAISLVCSDEEADITVVDGSANINDTADFVVTGYADETTCTASETDLPPGYSTDNSACTDIELVPGEDAPCTIANQQLPVDIFAGKVFTDGGATATFAIDDCGGEADIQVVTNSASEGSPAHYIISNFPWDGATCNVTEPIPPDGYYQVDSSCSDLLIVPSDDDTTCTITNAPTRATFAVTKDFTDDDGGGPENPTTVDVTLSCFTGLPLIQTQTIDQDQGVEFVVESFTHLELDCDVSEDLDVPELAGYTPTYTAGGNPGGTSDAEGCHFDDLPGSAENTCDIVNHADPVDIDIEKLWVIEGEGGDVVDQHFKLTLYCDAFIEDASGYCPGLGSGVDAPEQLVQYCKKFEGTGSQTFVASVTPEWPNSHCWVVETVYDDSVEIDNNCGDLVISHGQGASCVITNTVFFEGIPTLNQYGLAILALFMLGVGIAGFRRFA